MPRRRYYRRHNKDKYSVQQTIIRSSNVVTWTPFPATDPISRQWFVDVLPPTDLQGMRKVKHFTLTFSNTGINEEGDINAIYYALVYVPDGYEANPITIPETNGAAQMYDPNQYVISCGVLDFSGGPLRIRSPLSRNLNSGDRVVLILASTALADQVIQSVITYAITLQ